MPGIEVLFDQAAHTSAEVRRAWALLYYTSVFLFVILSTVASALLVIDAVKGPCNCHLVPTALVFNVLASCSPLLACVVYLILETTPRLAFLPGAPDKYEFYALVLGTIGTWVALVLNALQYLGSADFCPSDWINITAGIVPLILNTFTASMTLSWQVKVA